MRQAGHRVLKRTLHPVKRKHRVLKRTFRVSFLCL